MTMTKTLSFVFFFCCLAITNGQYDEAKRLRPLSPDVKAKRARENALFDQELMTTESATNQEPYIGKQDGMKQADKIVALPGQPANLKLEQYSGHVTINPQTGKALFYYFVESPRQAAKKPLVLWLNGGPGCSSLGGGAFTELGPFYVNSDRKTLRANEFAWNNVANILFLESPAGVGFSYSNSTNDYKMTGDRSASQDAYTFLLNWLNRFPEYKGRDFYIAGESYAGRYIPLLANYINHKNLNSSTIINLKGVAIGNPYFNENINEKGTYDFLYSRDLISKDDYDQIQRYCAPFTGPESLDCYMRKEISRPYKIDDYNIYAPVCHDIKDVNLPYDELTKLDPCLENYTITYLNQPEVQRALHADAPAIKYKWDICSKIIDTEHWHDSPPNMVPVMRELLSSRIRIWIYSGDVDSVCPITATKYFLNELGVSQTGSRIPWFSYGREVGGFTTKYDGLTFTSVRGAGHMVPRDQPHRALVLFSSFLQDKLPTQNPDFPNLGE